MAGQAPQGSQGHGRSSRRGSSVRPAAEASEAAPGARRGRRNKPKAKGATRAARPGRRSTADQATGTTHLAAIHSQLALNAGQGATAGSLDIQGSPGSAGSPAKAKVICRLLELRGLTSDEATRLTAFLHGLPTSDLGWSLPQLNRLLFLRRLREAGAFDRGRSIHMS